MRGSGVPVCEGGGGAGIVGGGWGGGGGWEGGVRWGGAVGGLTILVGAVPG